MPVEGCQPRGLENCARVNRTVPVGLPPGVVVAFWSGWCLFITARRVLGCGSALSTRLRVTKDRDADDLGKGPDWSLTRSWSLTYWPTSRRHPGPCWKAGPPRRFAGRQDQDCDTSARPLRLGTPPGRSGPPPPRLREFSGPNERHGLFSWLKHTAAPAEGVNRKIQREY